MSSKKFSNVPQRPCFHKEKAPELTWFKEMIDYTKNGTSMGFLCSTLNSSQRLYPFSLFYLQHLNQHFLCNYLSCREELKTVGRDISPKTIFLILCKEAAALSFPWLTWFLLKRDSSRLFIIIFFDNKILVKVQK